MCAFGGKRPDNANNNHVLLYIFEITCVPNCDLTFIYLVTEVYLIIIQIWQTTLKLRSLSNKNYLLFSLIFDLVRTPSAQFMSAIQVIWVTRIGQENLLLRWTSYVMVLKLFLSGPFCRIFSVSQNIVVRIQEQAFQTVNYKVRISWGLYLLIHNIVYKYLCII